MIILTGGAGFIGSVLLSELNARGIDQIIVVDSLGLDEKWQNLATKRFVDFWDKDSLFANLEQSELSRPEAVIHLGACTSTLERNSNYMISNNYQFSKRLAKWCLANNVKFIYASSAATYGDGSLGFSDDLGSVRNLRPLNIYGYSKQLFDVWALDNSYFDTFTGIKFFNVFGPNEYHKGVMASIVGKAFNQLECEGKIPLFKSHRSDYKDGEQKRDFIYVKDCAKVLVWLLEHKEVSGLFNLGTGQARTWKDLARAICKAAGKAESIEYIPMPEELKSQYQYFTEAPMEKLRQVGYSEPFTTLEAAVEDYVRNYLSQTNRHL